MGNVPSHLSKSDTGSGCSAYSSAVLDVDNMPFLRPPPPEKSQIREPIKEHNSPVGRKSVHSLDVSPILPPPSQSPMSTHTQWNPSPVKWPAYYEAPDNNGIAASPALANRSPTMMSPEMRSISPTNRSPSSSHSGSSISSQLSFLSQASPQKNRTRFSGSRGPVDANVPPPVPPHVVLRSRRPDHETESALAAIDSLECEVEDDEVRFRSRNRPRSVSRPRSISRRQSHSRSKSDLSFDDSMHGTDVYTRKCIYKTAPDLTCEQSDSESEEPQSPDNTFVLDGYNEGTRLRVINLESQHHFPGDSGIASDPRAQQYRVKSKALRAEEEELRQRKRYARYGHTFRSTREREREMTK